MNPVEGQLASVGGGWWWWLFMGCWPAREVSGRWKAWVTRFPSTFPPPQSTTRTGYDYNLFTPPIRVRQFVAFPSFDSMTRFRVCTFPPSTPLLSLVGRWN